MGQAKGILPRHGDEDVLKDPRSCGYFIAVAPHDGLDRAGRRGLG
jgi:hypothetical protein